MVLNAESLVHTATVNSSPISISVNTRIKEDEISDVVVMKFPNIVLWMVVWCFGRDTDMFRGCGSKQNCHHAVVINFSSTKVNLTVQYIIFRSNIIFRREGVQGSRDQ